MKKSQINGQLSLFNDNNETLARIKEYKNSINEKYIPALEMHLEGYTRKQITETTGISDGMVYNIIKDLRKWNNTYNNDHVIDKYNTNNKFLEEIKPKSVLDLHCGIKNFYKNKIKNTTTNDKDEKIKADYNMDAFKCLCYLYSQGKKYDLVDLDPYGNACECFDLSIKMAKKGLVITFGESNNCRRFDKKSFVRNNYHMSFDNYNIDGVINYVKEIGRANKKHITPKYIKNWKGVWRVWFKVESFQSRRYRENKNKQIKNCA